MDHSLPGSSVHGILQARILEWVAMPSSRESSQPRDWTCVSCHSCIAGGFFITEPLGKPNIPLYRYKDTDIDIYTHRYHIFFIHSSISGYLGCFRVLAIVNSVALNIGVHVSFWIIVLSRYMPRSGVAGSYGSSVFIVFFRLCHGACRISVSRPRVEPRPR